MADDDVVRESRWTAEQLIEDGFRYCERRSNVVMAREVPPEEAPLVIETEWDTLVAEAGYMICFDAGHPVRESLYAYPHWPVRSDHFADLYRDLEDPAWEPTPGQLHLRSLGCKPYFRCGGVWARRLTYPVKIQTPESPEPAVVPAGAWLLIGGSEEFGSVPYSADDATFRARYVWQE